VAAAPSRLAASAIAVHCERRDLSALVVFAELTLQATHRLVRHTPHLMLTHVHHKIAQAAVIG